jgi:hypothetical protein
VNAELFYRAFLDQDEDALADVLDRNAVLIIRGESVLTGDHRGVDGILELRRLIDRLTDTTWRPLRPDSFDIAASEHHAVIMDRYIAERGVRKLDSHEAIVVAPGSRSPIRHLFHYVHDPAAHAAFWSR